MERVDLTVVVIAKNEAEMIRGCLDCLQWCSQIVVIDQGSIDDTALIAENCGAKVIQTSFSSFARLRTEALKHVSSNWLMYIDADERVTPLLAKEIAVNLETNTAQVFTFKRNNYHFGALMNHGGWQSDYVTRVFSKSALKEWTGEIHESPVFTGTELKLQTPLDHFTHRSTASGLIKSAEWTPIEARLLLSTQKTPVTPWTIIRKGIMEFYRRYYQRRGFKDGMPGFIESLTQGINRALIYMQIWELQQKPSIISQYQHLEKQIEKQWKEGR